ncbi:MAG TPA: hypothetical protein V6C81_06445 [Planktothrix sp.]|jgi:hypothetical protein
MLFVLRQGLDTAGSVHDRLLFLTEHRWLWTCGWVPWNIAALAILYLVQTMASAHASGPSLSAHLLRFAVIVTATAVPCDLSAETIQMAVLPSLASDLLLNQNVSPALFTTMSNMSLLLTGFLANGLYSIGFAILVVTTRREYNRFAFLFGSIVALTGFYLSYACLISYVPGMFWSNAIMLPALVFWLAIVASASEKRAAAASLAC